MSNEGALSVKEFCERYRVGQTTFYAEKKSGRLEAVKVGRRTLISVEAANRWFEALPKASPARHVG